MIRRYDIEAAEYNREEDQLVIKDLEAERDALHNKVEAQHRQIAFLQGAVNSTTEQQILNKVMSNPDLASLLDDDVTKT